MKLNRICKIASVLAVLGGLCLIPMKAQAQVWFDCLADHTITTDDIWVKLSSDLLGVWIGASGSITWGNDGDNSDDDKFNDPEAVCFLTPITGEVQGRFAFWSDQGSLFTDRDDLVAITFGSPWASGEWCYATIRVVDGTTTTDKIWGSSEGGTILPTNPGASNNYLRGVWNYNGPQVWCDMRIDMLGDTARIRWDFYNFENHVVQVGLRFGQWIAPKQADNSSRGFIDNDYIIVPGQRPKQVDYIADRLEIGSSKMPPYVDFYFGQSDFAPDFRQWIKRDNQHPDLTQVDRFELMEHTRLLLGRRWQGFHVPDLPLVDPTYAVFYNPVNVAPNSLDDFNKGKPGLRIIQYMGLANGASDVTLPVAVTTEAPKALQFSSSSLNGLSPNPFKIYGTVTNGYSVVDQELDLTNITLAVSLPPGFKVTDGQVQKTIARLGPNDSQQVSWDVESDGTSSGELSYRVAVSASPANAKTITNTMLVSPTNRLKTTPGYNLVSLPFTFDDARFDTIFGVSGLKTISIDQLTGRYIPIDTAVRGQGVWLDTGESNVFSLNGAHTPTGQQTSSFPYSLQSGWQMIGDPWLYPVPLGQIIFVGSDDPTKSFNIQDAINLKWIKGVLYYFDKALGEYLFTQDLSTAVQPMVGYWVKVTALKPVQMIWPPVFAVGVGGSPRATIDPWLPKPGHYRLQIAARTKAAADTQTYFGVSADSNDGADNNDIPEPPMVPDCKLNVSIDHSDWGQDAGLYAQDVRSSSQQNHTWFFTVNSYEDADVTMTWPNLSQLPKDVAYRLTDLQSGIVRNLRGVSAYTFHTAEGQRKFKLEQVPGTPGKVAITGMNTSQGRSSGVTIQYSLSGEATTSVRVLSAAGKLVQTISASRAEGVGAQSHVWNTRDAQGIAMPPGSYIIEVTAVTTDGQVARVVRPHVLTR